MKMCVVLVTCGLPKKVGDECFPDDGCGRPDLCCLGVAERRRKRSNCGICQPMTKLGEGKQNVLNISSVLETLNFHYKAALHVIPDQLSFSQFYIWNLLCVFICRK